MRGKWDNNIFSQVIVILYFIVQWKWKSHVKFLHCNLLQCAVLEYELWENIYPIALMWQSFFFLAIQQKQAQVALTRPTVNKREFYTLTASSKSFSVKHLELNKRPFFEQLSKCLYHRPVSILTEGECLVVQVWSLHGSHFFFPQTVPALCFDPLRLQHCCVAVERVCITPIYLTFKLKLIYKTGYRNEINWYINVCLFYIYI